eukprot:TRINITY_DN7319_c0_g2_i1.p1 TRINITY_DN7319_c0_g2~~TRINITY_DN7319_c0_g2_i1.p1  ORF type:complete len:192 (-),score=38.97 TRINITY_DN7319_c0_g2_i1:41-616(-)
MRGHEFLFDRASRTVSMPEGSPKTPPPETLPKETEPVDIPVKKPINNTSEPQGKDEEKKPEQHIDLKQFIAYLLMVLLGVWLLFWLIEKAAQATKKNEKAEHTTSTEDARASPIEMMEKTPSQNRRDDVYAMDNQANAAGRELDYQIYDIEGNPRADGMTPGYDNEGWNLEDRLEDDKAVFESADRENGGL